MPVVFAEATTLANLTTAFEFIKTVFSGMVTLIMSEPVLLLPVGIFVAGAGIGLAMRLIRG